jgi:cis-3-alkyl-4-acyloxetan-2-one decarboxylase
VKQESEGSSLPGVLRSLKRCEGPVTIAEMTFLPPPPLPDFLTPLLPFRRAVYVLQSGPDAGRRIHFIDHGDPAARPVLMLHGNPTWSFLWRKVIAGLSGFRCVAPDLLGLGFSDRLPRIADHSVERHGAAIAALVEALDLGEIILVGQDWGGPIAAQVGARLPERIAGLVLANTTVTVPHKPKGTWFHRFARVPVVSDLVFRGLGFPQNRLGSVQGDPRSIHGEVAQAYRWPLRTWRDRVAPLALARMVPNSPDHASIPALRRGEAWARSFTGPVALVWGLSDPILGSALRHIERIYPEAPVTRTQAGHFLQEEVPEDLAVAVEDVARRVPT